mmetsp:Transcript_19923/g.22565  ORF Transcript_19923/g.22565 Transcript_19923/m.22565 type:complete len:654 (-) Transcript_19923:130-2091(-)
MVERENRSSIFDFLKTSTETVMDVVSSSRDCFISSGRRGDQQSIPIVMYITAEKFMWVESNPSGKETEFIIPFSDCVIAQNDGELAFLLYAFTSNLKTLQELRFDCERMTERDRIVATVNIATNAENKDQRYFAILLNPVGGKKLAKRLYELYLKPLLNLCEIKFDYFETQSATFVQDWTKCLDFNRYTEIICVGGDGLVNQYLNGVYHRPDRTQIIKIPIGVIPAGSQNALACSLGGKNAQRAALHILHRNTTLVDLMKISVDDATVVASTAAAWGIVSEISSEAEGMRKYGPTRYVISGIKHFFKPIKKYKVKITYSGVEHLVDSDHIDLHANKEMIKDFRDIHHASVDLGSSHLQKDILRAATRDLTRYTEEEDKSPDGSPGKFVIREESIETIEHSDAKIIKSVPKTDEAKEPLSNIDAVIKNETEEEHKNEQKTSQQQKKGGETENKETTTPTAENGQTSEDNREDPIPARRSTKEILEGLPVVEKINKKITGLEVTVKDKKTQEGEENIPECLSSEESDPFAYSFALDDHNALEIQGDISIVSVLNHTVKSSLSNEVLAPHASINGGHMDLLILPRIGRCRFLEFFAKLQNKGKHIRMKKLIYVKAKSVLIEPQIDVVFNIDGEHFGSNKIKVDVLSNISTFYGIPE